MRSERETSADGDVALVRAPEERELRVAVEGQDVRLLGDAARRVVGADGADAVLAAARLADRVGDPDLRGRGA